MNPADDITVTLRRVDAVALLEATDEGVTGPLVGARQRLRQALGTDEIARRAATREPLDTAGHDATHEKFVRQALTKL